MQRALGVAERMESRGRQVVRDHLTGQHREFFAGLRYLVLGAVDGQGLPWSTLREGSVGFIRVENERTLHIEADERLLDPAQSGLSNGNAVAALGIQLDTGRRNRANGWIVESSRNGFDIGIEHSFGNCAKHIRLRDHLPLQAGSPPVNERAEFFRALEGRHIAMIGRADTFFVASYCERKDGARQVDVSHRGGCPGFIDVSRNGWLTIPDYAGNNFFNTLGNVLVTGKAGLTFPSFENGTLLQMTGDAEVNLNSGSSIRSRGAERTWRFRPRKIVERSDAFSFRLKLVSDLVLPPESPSVFGQ
ncbi:pyridoxamine 5'-phosphate oxidase family protein [Tardiphaga sp. 709]|uniref:pyridoxamine 5'-phosphate oxidase family protein n=1 Tax=Tardiphaga sp. 709 TaxID=3076039 RepID=UPI0028E33F9F|nr:pyridoxamine 5'-phosphate oxidase family protein [Tardiphaga sp. 709]WNV11768.1 pyridoxamine 5'-phosphate oxidase family protein [Tardiphaga sp. 709]